ncbi:MAG: Flp pilus assembly protein CpaB [Clostridia bacterium]|nr:Flp pilus assembly protein CpaB [Clostridia bacterium]
MESVNRKVILISLIMAILTAFLVYAYIKKATAKPEVVEYINTYAAARTLPPKHKITDGDIKIIKVTREYLNPKAVLNKADIIGRRLKDSVIEGEQILVDRLADESKATLAYRIPEGKRAVSINVTEQTEVADHIRPGDYVDVIASFDKEEIEDVNGKMVFPRITRTIIQNAAILALGQDQVIPDEKQKELPKTVTLAVNAQEAERLVYASEFGTIRLALRNAGDDKVESSQGYIRQDITGEKGSKILPK